MNGRPLGIRPLPRNLDEAIRVMESSELVAEALGDHVFDFFLRNKRAEFEEYPPPGHPDGTQPAARNPVTTTCYAGRPVGRLRGCAGSLAPTRAAATPG